MSNGIGASLSALLDSLSAPDPALLGALGALGLGLLSLTVIAAPWLIARLPADHFVTERVPKTRHPGLRFALMVVANTFAAIALLLGLAMLVLPGPGIVMLVIALSLADFPGRQAMIRRLATQPSVFASLNWLRARRSRPPFLHPDANGDGRPEPVAPHAATTTTTTTATATADTDSAPSPVTGPVPSDATNDASGPRAERLWLCALLALLLMGKAVAASAQQAEDAAAELDAAAGEPVPEAPSADSVAERIRETQERMARLDAALAESRAEREALAARLADAEASASERERRVAGLDADITRYEANLADLEAEVAGARAGVAERRERLADSLRRLARVTDAGPLAVLLRHEDPATAERVSTWAGYALRAQRAEIDRETETLARIEAAHRRTLEDRNWLGHIRRKAAGQRDERLAAAGSTRGRVAEVETRITETTRSVATLRGDTERLQSLLEELRAAEAARSGYFEAGKGEWPLPVAGRIDARFGDVKSVGRLTWDGLFIRAENGQQVSAVADGEVVYSDWLTGFGNLVIVDHGDGWMTLYGGNRDLLVPTGAWVESGATIATVGDSGGQNVSGLYFEIREDARPVNPEPWLLGTG